MRISEQQGAVDDKFLCMHDPYTEKLKKEAAMKINHPIDWQKIIDEMKKEMVIYK